MKSDNPRNGSADCYECNVRVVASRVAGAGAGACMHACDGGHYPVKYLVHVYTRRYSLPCSTESTLLDVSSVPALVILLQFGTY